MFCTFECFFIALASLLWTCSFCAFFFTNFIFRNVRPSTSGSWILGRPINQLWNCDSFEIDLLIILGMLASVQVIAGNKSSFLSPLKERSNLFFLKTCLNMTLLNSGNQTETIEQKYLSAKSCSGLIKINNFKQRACSRMFSNEMSSLINSQCNKFFPLTMAPCDKVVTLQYSSTITKERNAHLLKP